MEITFIQKILKKNDFQGTSVINFPDIEKYTRIHEPKHLHPERKKFLILTSPNNLRVSIQDNDNPIILSIIRE